LIEGADLMRPSIRAVLVWTALAAPALAPAPAVACPSCKEAVAAQGGDAARLSNGYSSSILLMIAMPLALMGTGAFVIARAARRGALPPL
jgi:hypothetical protein